jgi:hypothetical protein
MKRRNILKIGLALAALCIAGVSSAGFMSRMEKVKMEEPGQLLIGCITDSHELEELMAAHAMGKRYNIIFARRFTGDLTNLGCSAFVIDRRLISRGQWQDYVDYLNKTGEDPALLIVDDIRDWAAPEGKNITYAAPCGTGDCMSWLRGLDDRDLFA